MKFILIYNYIAYKIILSDLLKFNIESSNLIVELEVFSRIFFILFFRLKYILI